MKKVYIWAWVVSKKIFDCKIYVASQTNNNTHPLSNVKIHVYLGKILHFPTFISSCILYCKFWAYKIFQILIE